MIQILQFFFVACVATSVAHATVPPHDIKALFTTANAHYSNGNYDDAAQLYKQLFDYNHTITPAYYNYALCHHHLGNFETAHDAFLHVYDKDPAYATTQSKLRLHFLRMQQWNKAQTLGVPRYWWYNDNLANKTVLFTHNGAGIGDIIQFLRYIKIIHEHGGHTIVQAPSYIHALLKPCDYIDQLIAPHTTLDADITYPISTPALAMTMQSSLKHETTSDAYLAVNQKRLELWQKKLAHDTHYKIGLCWRSSMITNPTTKTSIPSARSISLSALSPLLQNKQCHFYSLQVGAGTEELEPLKNHITIFDDSFDRIDGPFTDTVAVMKQLDLVITVDTSLAHIAGALGVPVWVMLPTCSDFRWFLDAETTPWYGSMRLFRQTIYNDWSAVVDRLIQELDAIICKKNH